MPKESQSQLKRLKSALKDSGLSRQDKNKKTARKSRTDREKELSKIRDRFNPYETQINRSKFAVGGRKLKGTEGRPGASAAIAEQMRHETIGREKARKGRTGGLLDRRFGEGRADLTPDEVQLERYTREQQRAKKRNNFSLEDEEDAELGLTHLGQSLEEMDDFGPVPVSDDEDMGAEMVARTNFGGFKGELGEDEVLDENGQKRKKTKAEVMQEIIAKSKQGRNERQRQAEADDDEREALDAELEDLQMLLRDTQNSRPKDDEGINAERLRAIQEDTEYDRAIKEMIYDRRAQATDRTKTEEELIEEEAKRLHEQEEQRMKRMRGEDVDKTSNKRRRMAQGDDLSDDFADESEEEESDDDLGDGVNAAAEVQFSDEDDDVDDEASEENGSIDDKDSDDSEDELAEAAEAELERRGESMPSVAKQVITDDPSQLKFTYTCPGTLEALLAITEPLSDDDVKIALHRIRVLHHPKLNPANNEKLTKYTEVLIEYCMLDLSPILFHVVTKHIQELSKKYWEASVTKFLAELDSIRQTMYLNLRKIWKQKELRLFKCIGDVWSTSDAYHKVATPAMLVAAQYLAQNGDTSSRGSAVKVELCQILFQWTKESKRYIPEIIFCLREILERHSKETSQDLIESASQLVLDFAQLYISSVAYLDIFHQFMPLLDIENASKLEVSLKNAQLSRKPLLLHSHRPIPLALSIPKFEEGYNPDKKSYDKNLDRQADQKLRKEVHDAKRSAVRVLRRDAGYEARQAKKTQQEKDSVYNSKVGKLETKLRQKQL